MTRDEIGQAVRDAHTEFLATLAKIPDDVIVRERVMDWWSLKDILGHVTVWYLVALEFIREYQRGDTPTPLGFGQSDDEVSAYNKRQVVLRRDYALARVRAELDAAYRDLLAAIAKLNDADVRRQLPPPWDAGDNLERLIAVNTYLHLPEHIAQIRKWKSTPRV